MLSLMTIGLMLAGCSGSGGGVSSQVVSGNASVGAPLAGQVSLKDSSAQPQEKTAVIGSDGSFAFDVTGLKAPLSFKGSAIPPVRPISCTPLRTEPARPTSTHFPMLWWQARLG